MGKRIFSSQDTKIVRGRACLTWNALCILLFAAGFGVCFCVFPKYLDDYWYMQFLRPWYDAQGIDWPEHGGNIFKAGIPWRLIFDTWREHWEIDNIRLPNLLAPILLIFPKWFGSAIASVIFVWSAFLGLKLADVDIRRSPLVPVALILWTLMLPLSDHFGCLVFQLNYFLPTWFALLLLLRLKKRAESGKSGGLAWTICLALLLGLSQEGIAAVIAAGILTTMVFCKKWRSLPTLASVIVLCIGVAVLLSAPGMRNRMAASGSGTNPMMWFRYFHIFLRDLGLVFVADVLLGILTLLRNRFRLDNTSALSILLFVSCVANIGASPFVGTGGRLIYWFEFADVILFILLIRKNLPKLSDSYNTVTWILTLPLTILMCWHLVSIDIFTFKARRVFKTAYFQHIENPKSWLFESEPMSSCRKSILGRRPIDRYTNTVLLLYVDLYKELESLPTMAGDTDYTCLMPHEFAEVTENSGELLAGGSGIRRINGRLFMPYDILERSGFTPNRTITFVDVDYGKGWRRVGCNLEWFCSPVDGKRYVWVMVETPWHLDYIRTLQGARMILRQSETELKQKQAPGWRDTDHNPQE